jgi:hypothetical protein
MNYLNQKGAHSCTRIVSTSKGCNSSRFFFCDFLFEIFLSQGTSSATGPCLETRGAPSGYAESTAASMTELEKARAIYHGVCVCERVCEREAERAREFHTLSPRQSTYRFSDRLYACRMRVAVAVAVAVAVRVGERQREKPTS